MWVTFITTFAVFLLAQCIQSRGQWVGLSPTLPYSLGEVSGANVNENLYVLGQGQDKISNQATCVIALRPLGTSWDCSLAPRPYPGNHHAVIVPGDGTFWLVGGLDSSSSGKVRSLIEEIIIWRSLITRHRYPLLLAVTHTHTHIYSASFT